MKTISTILGVAFVIISVCLVLILKSGVSIRTAPIIKPSVVSNDLLNIPQGIFLRLFPDIQQAHYIIWNVDQNSGPVQTTLASVKERAEKDLHATVTFIYDGIKATAEEVKACPRPCWILFPPDQINELSPNDWLQKNIAPLGENYFTISWIDFIRKPDVPEACVKEKRLDLECLKVISVNEVDRHMKEPSKKYFFMRKYLDHDYFLFVEN